MTPVSLQGVAPAPVDDGKLRPTGEQQAAIDVFASGDPLVLEAGAGTGKTSTLRLMAAAKPREQGVYVAYNKAIADDARGSFPKGVDCRTAHSFAFRAVGKDYRDRLNGPRVPGFRVAEILGAEKLDIAPSRTLRRTAVARLAMETVGRFCNSADPEPTVDHVPWTDGVEYVQDYQHAIATLAGKAWAELQQHHGQLRFTHDCYLKLWALTRPTLHCDYLLLDEAQDANPVIADVVLRQDAQLVAVGDEQQAIYGWRGAVDAMKEWPAEARLQLSQSFRFGPAVADEANVWLGLLDASLRLSGLDLIPSRVEALERPRTVLCRTNVECIAQALEALAAGRKVAIVGGTQEIQSLCRAAQELQAGEGTDHRDLCAFETWAEVQEYVEEDNSASDLRVLVRLIDQHSVKTMLRVAASAVDEQRADLIVSTAHKAKGREWESVRIAPDFRAPEGDEFDRSEGMLAYVAVTRAKLVLDNGSLRWARDMLSRRRDSQPTKGSEHAPGRALAQQDMPMSRAERIAENDANGLAIGRVA